MKVRALVVGLVLAIVIGAGGWFTVAAWLERPAGDGDTPPASSTQATTPPPDPVIAAPQITVPETPAPETPVPETPVPDAPGKTAESTQATTPPPDPVIAAPQITVPETPAPETPVPETPVPDAPGKTADQSGDQSGELKVTVDDLSGRLKTLEQRLKTSSSSTSAAPPLSASSSASPAPLPRKPPLTPMLALLALHTAIVQGAPFAAELATLERGFAGNPALLASLAPLKPWSGRGVATVARLRSLLEAQIPAILRAARPPVDDSGPWLKRNWARSWERLRALVVIRRIGEDVPGTAPDAIIARAEAVLAKHDIAGAVTELSALKGAAAVAAKDWLAQARARLAADGALAAIIAGFAKPLAKPPAKPPVAMTGPVPGPVPGPAPGSGGNGGRR